MKEIASKSDPGDYYGLKFPYTKDRPCAHMGASH